MKRVRRCGAYLIWTILVWGGVLLSWWTTKPDGSSTIEYIWSLGVDRFETEAGLLQLGLFGLINLLGALLLKQWFRSIRIEADLQDLITFGRELDGEKLLRLRAERSRMLDDAKDAYEGAGRWKKGEKRKARDKAASTLASIDRALDLIGVKAHKPRKMQFEVPD